MKFIEVLKEQWIATSKATIMILLTVFTIVWVLPLGIHRFMFSDFNIYETSFYLAFIVILICCFVIYIHLLMELNKMYLERDLAFYVPISILKIIYTRILNEFLISFVLILVIVGSMALAMNLDQSVPNSSIFPISVALVILSLVLMISVICSALFTFPIWLWLNKRVGKFSYFIIFCVTIVMIYASTQFSETNFYKVLFRTGPLYTDFLKADYQVYDMDIMYKDYFIFEDFYSLIIAIIAFFIGIWWTKRVVTK